jgi:hypothetical protein
MKIPALFRLLKVQNEAQAFTVWLAMLVVAACILGVILGKLTFG